MSDNPDVRKKFSPDQLRKVLVRHKRWIQSGGSDDLRADLSGADLPGADLSGADLSGANLSGADLSKANLSGADLSGANCHKAILLGANLTLVDLSRASLIDAELSQADLRGAFLARSNLHEARLHTTDMRSVRGLQLDYTYVRGAQFSPLIPRWKAWLFGRFNREYADNDPWTVLRQLYSGPRTLFLFFFVVLFALPYFGRAAFFSTVSNAEQRVIDGWNRLKNRWRNPHRVIAGPSAETIPTPYDGAEEWVRRHSYPQPLWQVLLRWDEGKVGPTILAVALILYNFGVYWLITGVGPLRDEEERSGWSPAWRDYGYLRWVHRGVTVLFYVSFGTFLWNVWQLLHETVWVPATG